MNLLQNLYPGDQMITVLTSTAALVTLAILVAFVWSQLAARNNAALRSSIWIATLACALFGPVLVLVAVTGGVDIVALSVPGDLPSLGPPPSMDSPMIRDTVQPHYFSDTKHPFELDGLPPRTLTDPPEVVESALANHVAAHVTSVPISPKQIWRGAWGAFIGLWAVGVAVHLVQLVLGIRRLALLRSSVRPVDDARTTQIMDEIRDILDTDKLPQLGVSSAVSYPIAAGGLSAPLIILPEGLATTLDRQQLRDILIHECAHMVGHDFLVGMAQRLAQIPYWLFPPIYYLNEHLTRAREEVCDNYVLCHGNGPEYAQALLKLAQSVRLPPLPMGTVGFLRPGQQLETRVSRLLNERRNLMTRTDYPTTAFIAVVFSAVSLGIAGTRVVQAEKNTSDSSDAKKVATTSQDGPDSTAEAERRTKSGAIKAVEAIRRLGGKVEVDESKPDRPVVKVDLSNTSVTDDDLAELAGLTELRKLNLSSTRIGNAGLKHLKSLQKLRELILDETFVGNDGLEALASLTSLQQLGLRKTSITSAGLAHLRNLPQLRDLDIGFTSIDDTGMAYLTDLKLTGLQLKNCKKITSAGFVHLQALTELENLDLHGTLITDPDLAHLGGLTKLNDLGLAYTDVTDEGFAHLAGLTNLRKLVLAWSGLQKDDRKISDAGLAHLQGLVHLEYLNLVDSRVSDAGLRYLKGMNNLNLLLLAGRDTDFTGDGLQHLKGLKKLRTLTLGYTAVTDDSLAHIEELDLEYLSLYKCDQVTEAGLAHLKGMTSLTSLDVPSPILTDACLEHLKGLTKLESLNLTNPNVTDAGLVHLAALTKLETLYLFSSKVTDAGLVHLAGMTDLRSLHLSDFITGDGLRHLRACENLEKLYTGTGFTDEGMAHLEAFPHLIRFESESSLFSDAGLAHLRGLHELEELKFVKSPDVTSAGLRHLKELPNLSLLDISGTGIGDSDLAHLKGLKINRLWLNSHETQITDAGVEHLKALPLKVLGLNAPNLTAAGIAQLGELSGLTWLWTVNIPITDADLPHLKSLGNLSWLTLRRSLVTGAGLKENLQDLQNLRGLGLRDCPIADSDIVHLKQLTGLQQLNLFNTKVTEAGAAELQDGMPKTEIWHNNDHG